MGALALPKSNSVHGTPSLNSCQQPYLLRLDETGTPSYVGRGDSLSRPSTSSRESIGVGTSISSILNSYAAPNGCGLAAVSCNLRSNTTIERNRP